MKYLLPHLLSLFFLCSVPSLNAQNLSEFDKKLDRLLYNTNRYILDFSQCLSNLHKTIVQGKSVKYSLGNCNHETPWDIIQMQDNSFYLTMSKTHPALSKSFEELNKHCKAVVVDLKMERMDEATINQHIENFAKHCQDLNANSEAIRSKWRQAALSLLPKEVVAYLENERTQYKNIVFCLRLNLGTNFPEALLRKNIKDSDSLLVLLELRAEKDSKVHLILDHFRACQNSKRHYLNGLNAQNNNLASYQNNFYNQIHNHFNNGLINLLRVHYNTQMNLYIPVSPINNLVDEKTIIPSFKFQTLNDQAYVGQVLRWTFKDADALGELTTALNLAIRQTNHSTEALYKLKTDIERKILGKTNFAKVLHQSKLNRGDLEGVLGRLKLNKNEVFPLIEAQTQNLLLLLEDSELLFNQILVSIDNKNKNDLDYAETEKLLQQYQSLLVQLDKQLTALNLNIDKANSPKFNGQDSWSKSSRALHAYCVALHQELDIAEQKTFDTNITDNYDYTKVEKLASDLLEQEISMMKGIKKYGSGHGKCPYGIFEDVLETGLIQHKKVLVFKDSSSIPFLQGCCDGYYNMVRYYNETLDDYNKFSLQGAERDSDFARYDHKTPVVNPLILAKALQLPNMAIKAVPPPPPAPIPEPAPEPMPDTIKADPVPPKEKPEMTKAYIERCKPNNIIFLIDISASMNEQKKLQHFKDDLYSIAQLMRPEDMISIVSFEGKSTLELKQTTVTNHKKWEKAIEKLSGTGGTRFNEGLSFTYDYMQKILQPDFNNRVVLISDGAFKISDASIAMVQRLEQTQQIAFSALIYHPEAPVYTEISNLTTIGKGNYSTVASRESGAMTLFGEFSVLKAE